MAAAQRIEDSRIRRSAQNYCEIKLHSYNNYYECYTTNAPGTNEWPIYTCIPQPVCLLEVVEGKVRHLEDLVSLTKSVVATKIMFVCFYVQ